MSEEESSEEEIKEEVIEEVTTEEKTEEEAPEEYLPTEEEEITAPTAIDVNGLETMVSISDILVGTLRGSLSDNEAIKKIKELRQERVVRRRRVSRKRRRR